MYYQLIQLTNEERIAVAKRVADKAAGRVPVVAGGEYDHMSQCSIHVDLLQQHLKEAWRIRLS